ncbi:MAG: amidase [Burkholderiaceae bacterium]|nr:amidase [Burkholderiaceae bacterium]
MPSLMPWPEWARHDAVSLAALVRQGQASPAELARQAAEGIERIDPAHHSVLEVFDDVLADPGTDGLCPEGPFAGVPCLVQDIGPAMKGRRQEYGARLMAGHVAASDSFLTTRMRVAGLSLIGRTRSMQFGLCGPVANPVADPVAYADGSVGGAAIVASGAIPIAHASDSGGSIRIQAGVSGIIGLKASRGVFSSAPECSDLMSVGSIEGCHTRTVRDTALFVDACRGSAPGEFMPYWSAAEPYAHLVQRDPGRLRIALSHEWGDHRASPHIVGELVFAGRLLEALGHRVDGATPSIDYRGAYAAQTTCTISQVAHTIARLSRMRGHARPPGELIASMSRRIWEAGIDLPCTAREQMHTAFNITSRGFGQFFEDWDMLLTPVTAIAPRPAGSMDPLTPGEGESPWAWFSRLWVAYPYTPLANLAGTPALALPMGVHANGLPLGIQLLTRLGNDGQLLQLGAQIERALDGRWNGGRLPPRHVTRPRTDAAVEPIRPRTSNSTQESFL